MVDLSIAMLVYQRVPYFKIGSSTDGQAALARPWDAARSLVWPSAPPGCAEVMARGTVAAPGHETPGGCRLWFWFWVREIVKKRCLEGH